MLASQSSDAAVEVHPEPALFTAGTTNEQRPMKHPDGSALMADYELRRIEEGAISVPLSKQVLLLGTSDVGKSTLLRQLQLMRGSSGHPLEQEVRLCPRRSTFRIVCI